MQDNYNVNSVPAGEWPSGVEVSVSYEMPVKDERVTLMKDATAQLVPLITTKCRWKFRYAFRLIRNFPACKECINFHVIFAIGNEVEMLRNALIYINHQSIMMHLIN
jgi:hypothetical protein